MKISRRIVFLWFTLTSQLLQAQISWPAELIITPGKSEFLNTSTFADVSNFPAQLKLHSKEIHLISMGKSFKGKEIPVAVLSRPLVSTAAEAKASVDMAQPLANLIFYLLEPQSGEGLVTRNFFDSYLDKHGVNNKPVQYPVFKYYIKKYNHG